MEIQYQEIVFTLFHILDMFCICVVLPAWNTLNFQFLPHLLATPTPLP